MTNLSDLIERVEAAGGKLPCDVLLPPALRIRAGCSWITLLEAIEARREAKERGWPLEFTSGALRALKEQANG